MTHRLIILLSIAFVSCKKITKESNKETSNKSVSTWEVLTKKDSFEGWHIYQNEGGEKSGWAVENGVFTFNESDASGEGNKSLLTDEVFESFEIKFEWKLSPGSNSGFIWGVSEDKMYEHPHETGPEIQIIDINTEQSWMLSSPNEVVKSISCSIVIKMMEFTIKKSTWKLTQLRAK